jgi:hypothetical protein
MIVDYSIMVQGISVFDILDSKQQPVSHELTSFARLTDDDHNLSRKDVMTTADSYIPNIMIH